MDRIQLYLTSVEWNDLCAHEAIGKGLPAPDQGGAKQADGADYIITLPEGNIPPGGPQAHFTLTGSQDGSITVRGPGEAKAIRYGSGKGDAVRSGSGCGGALRGGSGAGDAICSCDGLGSASRMGSGQGNAVRDGKGPGNACRADSGVGDAIRKGHGKGRALRADSGTGSARVAPHNADPAVRSGSGRGQEEDARGARRRVTFTPGIHYPCTVGSGYLRIGCELHSLEHWIENAEEIDRGQVDNTGCDSIFPATLHLAERLFAAEQNCTLSNETS